MAYLAMATGFLLILLGLFGAISHRNLLRLIVGFTVADTGTHLVLVAVGFMPGRTAPILGGVVPPADAALRVIDPVPQALVLTAIVIGLGVTALMLAYAWRIYAARGTLDLSKLRQLKW